MWADEGQRALDEGRGKLWDDDDDDDDNNDEIHVFNNLGYFPRRQNLTLTLPIHS